MPIVSFSPGQVISSSNVNANFGLCVLTDTSRTVTVTHTFTATQTFTGGWSAAAACSISAGGLAVTGNSTITGTLTALTGVTSSGTAAFATVTASSSVTSDSWLMKAGSSTFVNLRGVTGDNSSANNTLYNVPAGGVHKFGDSGSILAQFSTALGLAMNVLPVSGVTTLGMSGTLTMSATASKLVPGATSFSHRNNADSADNLLITDAGVVTARGQLACSAAGLAVGGTFVVGPKVTGWALPTNTLLRTTFDTTTVTLPNLAARVGALISDLYGQHNLIGA